jgi:hypothetical protein
MNELGHLGLGGGGMEHGNESGVLNFILHSETILVSGEGVTYSQVSVVVSLCFSQYSICFVLRNYKLMTIFLC